MLNCWNDNSQDFQLFFPKIFNFMPESKKLSRFYEMNSYLCKLNL